MSAHGDSLEPGSAPERGEDPLERFRPEFPILDRKVYLNSNSLGALSRRSISYRREFERDWNELGASAWYELWLGRLEQTRAAFGRTVGAGPETIALLPSISAGLAARAPRSGKWTEYVKKGFGVAMILIALFFAYKAWTI